MSLAARKIEYNKWTQKKIFDGEVPSADAITRCMRTTDNTLSLWTIHSEDELDEAVLAIASCFHSLDAIDVLIVDTKLIENKELTLVPKPGFTPYNDFKPRHIDVSNLDYESLGRMADVMVETLKERSPERYTLTRLKRILKDGVDQGKIKPEELHEKVQKKLGYL